MAILYVVLLFALEPVLPDVATFFRVRGLTFFVLASCFFAPFFYFSAYLLIERGIRTPVPYALMILVTALALAVTWQGRDMQEHVHLFEYAVMAMLFYKALQFRLGGSALILAVLCLTVVLGYLDELWQGMLPGRDYNLRDVGDNAVGAVLGLMFLKIRYGFDKDCRIH